MSDLTEAEILALAKAAHVTIPQPLVREVAYSLNGLQEALDKIQATGLDEVEPLPIILPPTSR